MSIEIKTISPFDTAAWDTYISSHPDSTLYHLSGWKNVVEKTYGHKTFYLMAVETKINSERAKRPSVPTSQNQAGIVVGLLPLVHLKHFLFGNSLISIPFFDMSGILADDEETQKTLLIKAIELANDLGANFIELRNTKPLPRLDKNGLLESDHFHQESYQITTESNQSCQSSLPRSILCDRQRGVFNWGLKKNERNESISFTIKSHKVRMLVELPESSETLMKSFKSKLRSQIKKPMKEGLKAKIGGMELLDDFYSVFTINMRDLGSPVHSRAILRNVLEEFKDHAKIFIVYKEDQPAACSLIIGFKDILENPWASALRQYSRLGPNMLLYWTMLEYACDNGFKYFDFGRSTPGEGTYKFKEQWGAKPEPLHWHYISLNGRQIDTDTSEKSKFDKAIQYWQKLPVPVTRVIGPRIRKYIGL